MALLAPEMVTYTAWYAPPLAVPLPMATILIFIYAADHSPTGTRGNKHLDYQD